MYHVEFKFEDGTSVNTEVSAGISLLLAARESNVAIDAPCSGNGACGKCKVKLISGSLESVPSKHISDDEFAKGWRLACCSKVTGDVVVMVPEEAYAYKSRMKIADLSSPEEIAIFEEAKSQLADSGIEFSNNIVLLNVTMPEPAIDDSMPDVDRLTNALKEHADGMQVKIPYSVVRNLSQVLREASFNVQVLAAKTGKSLFVYRVYTQDKKVRPVGLALDIGTTTVSAILIDMFTGEILSKAAEGNGQIRFGADVINRIIESAKEGGQKRLQDAVIRDTINPMLQQMCKSGDIDKMDIIRMSVAGNTTMNHLFMGINADNVRMEPYVPVFNKYNALYANNVGVDINPDAHLIIAPNIGSYVGGDITAGTLVSMIWNKPSFSLFIDLGTNGEIVFGNSDFMMSCACSAGPAFEGGDISCGMRATDGAIEACTIDHDTMEPNLSIIGEDGIAPAGICGSGIIDLICELFKNGIINAKGKFIREGDRIRHDEYGMGSYVVVFEGHTESGGSIEINEVDIDSFIRAKGAIFSAIRTMLASLDFDVSVIEDIYVAGGIGSGINMENAVFIGMLPDVDKERFHYIGNTSLAGAYAMLYSTEAEKKTYEVASNMTYLELSTVMSYMDEFVAACFLPHTDASLFPSVKVLS